MDIVSTTIERGGIKQKGYEYTDKEKNTYPAGIPIILDEGKEAIIKVENSSETATNVHWHGLNIPNDQDGPDLKIEKGTTHTFKYTPKEAGTFWVHSHYRPVETQVEKGMYAPLIVRNERDKLYNLDEILMIGDVQKKNDDNSKNSGMDMEGMDMSGESLVTDTINGKSIAPDLELSGGQIGKLRFISASANNFKTIEFPFEVKVIAKDGYTLDKSYNAKTIELAPGQRVDVEVALVGTKDKTYTIKNGNAKVNINYKGTNDKKAKSLFIPSKEINLAKGLFNKTPDITMKLTENMVMNESGMKMDEMINGKIYPDTGTYNVKVGRAYKVQFENADTMPDMSHPMHIHGAHFQVISKNGVATNDTTWYDTYPMEQGIKTDIAIVFDKPGVWMVHCHILNHEDNGMMASFTAK